MTREGMAVPNTTLCEKLVSDDNLTKAAKKVRSNDGAPGIDGIPAEDALVYLLENQERIVSEIITRKYKPSPVRRVEIPKANGKKRLLGIPTVRDRIVQQALVQVLTPVFEPTFSDFSFGYRPNRSAEDAVRLAQLYMSEGYELERAWLCVSDAHKGLQAAVRKEFIGTSWQRCKVHFMRNILAYVGVAIRTPLQSN